MSTAGLRTWVEISRESLLANRATLCATLTHDAVFAAVVKANAYGHDLALVVKTLSEAGQRTFCTDSLDEALVVRRIAPDADVIVLGMVPLERVREVISARCILTVVDEIMLAALRDEAVAQQTVARVNIDIETGLYRLGATQRALMDLARMLAANDRVLQLVGIMTHFATAEDVDEQDYVTAQMETLLAARDMLAAYGLQPPLVHASCSASTILRADTHGTMVRDGIALYGLWPDHELRLAVQRGRAFELRPALSWRTTIAQVKDVPNGATVGYGRSFIANRPMRIAVMPVGYWDGYDRGLSGKGKVLVKGYVCPVVGRVCMNMTMIDVSAIPQVKAGDVATLIGREGMHTVSADDLAATLGTIHYEVVTRINPLLPRILV